MYTMTFKIPKICVIMLAEFKCYNPPSTVLVSVMPLDLASHHFLVYVSLGGEIGEKIENLPLKLAYFQICGGKGGTAR